MEDDKVTNYVYFDEDGEITHTTSRPDEYANNQPCVMIVGYPDHVEALLDQITTIS